MKQLILDIAAQFEAADAIENTDDNRKAWSKVVIELHGLMRKNVNSLEVYGALNSIWASSQCSNPLLVINALKWYAETFKPTYKHDCDRCTYHGTKTIDGEVYDFYTCNGTVIGRYDDDPPANRTWSLSDVDNHWILKHVKDFL